MRTYFPWTRRWLCWASLTALLVVAGCRQVPVSGATSVPPELAARLAAEPAACEVYRKRFVRAFQQHVAAMSRDDEAARKRAGDTLRRLRRELAGQGLDADTCSRPLCIIEPRQGGKLDSWCGFRLSDQTGARLYRWVAWPPADASARTEETP